MSARNTPGWPRLEYRSPPEPVTEPWGLVKMQTEDPHGTRIVLVEVPPGHPLRHDGGRLDRQGKRPLRGMSARYPPFGMFLRSRQ
jgi:hypothetical protein